MKEKQEIKFTFDIMSFSLKSFVMLIYYALIRSKIRKL